MPEEPSVASTAKATGIGSKLLLGALLGFLMGCGLIWALALRKDGSDGASPAPVRTVKLSIPSSTADYQLLEWPIISPDGKKVLFNAMSGETGAWAFWLRDLSSFKAERIPELDLASDVFWSADSKAIGHSRKRQIHALSLADRVPRSLPVARFTSATWSRTGSTVYGESVAVSSSDPRTNKTDIWIHGLQRGTRLNLTRGYSAWAGFPRWTPDGDTLVFASDRHGFPDIVSIPLRSPGEVTVLWSGKDLQMPIYFIPGTDNLLAAARVGGLHSVPAGEVGEPVHVVSPTANGQLTLRYSPDGRYLA